MTFDPTTNRIPFGLLTPEEQEALKAWPHGWEFHKGWVDEWVPAPGPAWAMQAVYRGKPAPVVTSKWFNVYPNGLVPRGHSNRKAADKCHNGDRIAVLRVDTCNGVSTVHLEEMEK